MLTLYIAKNKKNIFKLTYNYYNYSNFYCIYKKINK